MTGFSGSFATGCGVAAVLGRGLASTGLLAGFAALAVTVPFAFLATGFWAAAFAFALVGLAAACLAVVTAALDFLWTPAAAADLRVAFWSAVLEVARFAPAPPARDGFALARDTLTSPRMARPEDRLFAAAFAVARRADLLCEVEAMGTTLVTVATW
jgi:hypothetical protein